MTNLLKRKPQLDAEPGHRVMVVEVSTNRCAEGEAYFHEVIEYDDFSWVTILNGVRALYGSEGVNSIHISYKED